MEQSGEPQTEYIGVGKPEGEKRQYPVVEKVHQALGRWWERVGPGSVEKSWVSAHGRILNKIDGEERKQAFEKSAETWRKVGKGLGIASTAVDFSLAGLGIFLSVSGWRNGSRAVDIFDSLIVRPLERTRLSFVPRLFNRLFTVQGSITKSDEDLQRLSGLRKDRIGRIISVTPTLGSAGVVVGTGPAHLASRAAARVAGIAGKGIASGGNYVASGKAREHAEKIGGGLGKGIGSVATYALEHPEEVRKTFETVERVRRENEQHRERVASMQKEEAGRQLKHDYEEWLKGMDPRLKAFYVNSNTWPPPMSEMIKERQKDKKT